MEVPITFVERVHGTSKMNRDVMAEAALRITQWGVADRAAKLRPPR